MARDCYRCGQPVEDDAPFCPACNAPQVRVPGPAEVDNEFPPVGEPKVPLDDDPSHASTPGMIQWGLFFQIASPTAALAGLVSLLLPFGWFFMLPFAAYRTINKYRPHYRGLLRPSQGAKLGAFTSLLTFFSFSIFFLATISLKRDMVVRVFQESAQKNPEPAAQELLRFISTNEGFWVFTFLAMATLLVIFLVIGMIGGALITASKTRT